MQSRYKQQWIKELAEERQSLVDREVFEVVDKLLPGAKLLESKVVYKQKKNSQGLIVRFKCRCTAKGYSQIEFVHFYDTFASVAAGSYVCTVIAYAHGHGMQMRHLDVKTAFLYPKLREELYMKMPEGIAAYDGEVVLLIRSIYGT
eukprot:1557761-Rhodomonas_salina.1